MAFEYAFALPSTLRLKTYALCANHINSHIGFFRWFVGQPPKNLFVVNDDYDAAVALFWAEQNLVKKEPNGKECQQIKLDK